MTTAAGEQVWCAIHQPNFFPRLSTLAKLFTADIWVVLDDVQFTRRDYQHRCRLADLDGDRARWLTLPVHLVDGRSTRIHDVRLVDPTVARRRTDRLLKHHFRRSPHWPALTETLHQVAEVMERTDRLTDIAQTSTTALLRLLDWPGTILRSSELPSRTGRSERLADLTAAVGASVYLYGTGGARYLDHTPFRTQGIRTEAFRPPDHDDPRIWANARTLTSLHPLMTAGPGTTQARLRHHADSTRTRSFMAALTG